MIKKEIRQLFLEKRKALTAVERSKLDDLLLIQFQSTDIPAIESVLTYWPIEKNNEPNTHLFMDYLHFLFPDLIVLYPVCDTATGKMKAVQVNDDTAFVQKAFGVHEPAAGEERSAADIDMVITPLLAVDKNGYRVGYGKGFYDKFLSLTRPDCFKTGFCYFELVDSIDDCHEFDVPLNSCITPYSTYVF